MNANATSASALRGAAYVRVDTIEAAVDEAATLDLSDARG